ncbi:MAG: sterol desaturase family protein [Acidimicrobiia bacterium]|nr:sterol desaturase family protein [Acidimicrobiia bacterium]
MPSFVWAIAAFAAMEPVTAATHRFVMHGPGLLLHRSHHRRTHDGWEANDLYPVIFAAVVCLGLWIGFHEPAWDGLVPVGAGVTAYGAAYALVHDVSIHRRLRWFGERRPPALERLAAAHDLHHRYGGAPYGMLVPIVPAAVRARASSSERIAPAPGT